MSNAATRSAGHGAVVATRPEALAVGRAILDRSGNAVDAAVAMTFALAVCEPYMTGPAGVGEAIYFAPDNSCHLMNAIGLAPAEATPDMFSIDESLGVHPRGWPRVKDDANTFSVKAVTAPRLVSGLWQLHARCGRLPWDELVEPAIEIAKEGAFLDFFGAAILAHNMRWLVRDPYAAELYYPDGVPRRPPIPTPPQRVANEALVGTLEQIGDTGAEAITRGPVGAAIVDFVRAAGGVLSVDDIRREADLTNDLAPLLEYRGWELYGSPQPSGSPTAAAILGLLERIEPAGATAHGVGKYQAVIKACIAAGRERMECLAGDCDESVVRELLTPSHLDELAGTIGAPSADREAPVVVPTATTHCAATDADGGACSMTSSLVTFFGAQIGIPAAGVFLNNGMQWFDPVPGNRHSIAGGRRGMTAMSPVVMRHAESDKLLVLGGLGGPPIMTAIA